MLFRDATSEDIPQIQIVRNSVNENKLSNPALVTDADCLEFISRRGKGWICKIDEQIRGFAIVDLQESNVWALFVHPDFEGMGIGRKLQQLMLDWYFQQGKNFLWLATAPGTRAEGFYRKSGWMEKGMNGLKEIRFEMTKEQVVPV